MFTGSDTYWSGKTGDTKAILDYTLSNLGDAAKGQSISNIKLQDGSPVARRATGNATSTGMNRNIAGTDELGSNQIIGNEQNNTLNGGGVGGIDGKDIGVDTLTGGAGADRFVIGANYRSSLLNRRAISAVIPPEVLADSKGQQQWATNLDYAIITDLGAADTLQLSGSASDYVIGAAPGSSATPGAFAENNISGFNADQSLNAPTSSSTDFGIYYVTGVVTPELVATVNTAGGFNLGSLGANHSVLGINVDGTDAGLGGITYSNYDTANLNYLGFGAMYQLQGSDFASRVTFA
jgi:hypothetical protein